MINPRPYGRIKSERSSKIVPSKRKIHETLIRDKIIEVSHSRHTTLTRSFTREPSYIEITPYTPRHVPPTENPRQLIPKQSPIDTRIQTENTCKGLDKSIRYIHEGDCESELPQTHIYLLHHHFIPHDQDAP